MHFDNILYLIMKKLIEIYVGILPKLMAVLEAGTLQKYIFNTVSVTWRLYNILCMCMCVCVCVCVCV